MKKVHSAVAALVVLASLMALPVQVDAVTSTTDLTTLNPEDLAQSLVGPGVTVSNVSFTGDDTQGGLFLSDVATIGFEEGVVLSSGAVADTIGPNAIDGTTTAFNTPGDPDLDVLSGFATFDAAVLEFDFTADAETVFFRYVFASEEYNEFVNTSFNDSFGFFVNGTNCAVIDVDGVSTPITVNTINNGNPLADPTATNPAFYRNNDLDDGGGALNTEMDGLTIVLTCMAAVDPAGVNTMKLAIADASDTILDSAVFLEQGSLTTEPPTGTAKVTGGGRLDLDDGLVTLGGVAILDEQGLRGNIQINDHRDGTRFHGTTVDALDVDPETKTAVWSGAGRLNGEDGYTFELTVVDNRNGNSAKKGDPDTVAITIFDEAEAEVWSISTTDLRRGNFTVHE